MKWDIEKKNKKPASHISAYPLLAVQRIVVSQPRIDTGKHVFATAVPYI